MYRSQPVGNKLCYDKAVKRNKNKHKQALNQIKSSIDCRPPTSHKLYLNRRNLKKEYMKKERFLEILQIKLLLYNVGVNHVQK